MLPRWDQSRVDCRAAGHDCVLFRQVAALRQSLVLRFSVALTCVPNRTAALDCTAPPMIPLWRPATFPNPCVNRRWPQREPHESTRQFQLAMRHPVPCSRNVGLMNSIDPHTPPRLRTIGVLGIPKTLPGLIRAEKSGTWYDVVLRRFTERSSGGMGAEVPFIAESPQPPVDRFVWCRPPIRRSTTFGRAARVQARSREPSRTG